MKEKIKKILVKERGSINLLSVSILLGAIIIAVTIVFVSRTNNPPATNQKALTIENYNRPDAKIIEELATSTEEQLVATTIEKKLYFKLLGNELLRGCPAADCKVVEWGTLNGVAEIIEKVNEWYKVKVYEHGKYVLTEDCPSCGYVENLERPIIKEGWFHESLINEFAFKTLDPAVPPPLKTATVEPKPVSKQEQVVSPQTYAPPVPQKPQDNLPPEREIDPHSIVGIICIFNVDYVYPPTGEIITSEEWQAKGSGVIIDKRGYILTNKHVIENSEKYITITVDNQSVQLLEKHRRKYCNVGQIAAGGRLPTIDEIKTLNPTIRIPVAGYTADVVYTPSGYLFSATEKYLADFAILKISGLSQDGPTFGVTFVPSVFPYAETLDIKKYFKANDAVITYGTPGDVTEGKGDFSSTMYIVGGVGTVTRIEFGDSFFEDTPLSIWTKLEIRPGRSGSPLFWRGYVIGLTTAYLVDNVTESRSVAMDAILQDLKLAGLGF